ncbi:MAG: hypothetical protein PHX08_04440 [Lachnospiraceae bacterium]|nr:hypothetical protein [Lachnospiraceae bacterium]
MFKTEPPPTIDGLDKQDIEIIKSKSAPWQQKFITRFYKKLEENNLSKKDICDLANRTNNKIIGTEYQLQGSTLSQYTNYKSKAFRPLSVDALISVSNALNVSIDYLLGIESSEQHDITNIHDVTGLTESSIEILKFNSKAQDFINALLQSSNLSTLLQQLDKIFHAEYISSDILSAYSETLIKLISSSFSKYMNVISPLEENPDSYKKFLKEEIENSNIVIDKFFLSANVSDDRFNQISILSEYHNVKLSQAFLDDTVSCVYEILSYNNNADYYRSTLSDSFFNFIEEFLSQKEKNLAKHLKNRK